MRRPAAWVVLALFSAAAAFASVRYFPQAFSIVALDITMDRGHALDQARAVAAIQLIGILAVGFIGLALLAAVVGLAIGAIPHRLAGLGRMPQRDVLQLGIGAGLAGAAAVAVAAWLRTPEWAQFPSVGSLGSVVPWRPRRSIRSWAS